MKLNLFYFVCNTPDVIYDYGKIQICSSLKVLERDLVVKPADIVANEASLLLSGEGSSSEHCSLLGRGVRLDRFLGTR